MTEPFFKNRDDALATLKVLKRAKHHLARTKKEVISRWKKQYICHSIESVNAPWKHKRMTKNLIMAALGDFDTLRWWYEDTNHKRFYQHYRMRWLNQLINDLENAL